MAFTIRLLRNNPWYLISVLMSALLVQSFIPRNHPSHLETPLKSHKGSHSDYHLIILPPTNCTLTSRFHVCIQTSACPPLAIQELKSRSPKQLEKLKLPNVTVLVYPRFLGTVHIRMYVSDEHCAFASKSISHKQRTYEIGFQGREFRISRN